jgi:hypothetical protein
MDNGIVGLSDLLEQFKDSDRQSYLRAMLSPADDERWELVYAEVIVGSRPPGWQAQTWEYQQIAFVADALPADALAALFSSADPAATMLGGLAVSVPACSDQTQWSREPSRGRYHQPLLPWPTTDFQVTTVDHATTQAVQGLLVGRSCPSFPDSNSAWRAFFQGDFSLNGTQIPSYGHLAQVRVVADDAWIGQVHITATQLTVEVDGRAVAGAQLELYGATDRSAQLLEGPGTVVFDLADGLPDYAWIWLNRGLDWLDHRSLDSRRASAEDLAARGVDIDIPVEPAEAVEALIFSGEGPYLEFKRKLPSTSQEKRHVFKTVAAFATGEGGTMIFGVDRDEVTVTGLGDEDPGRLRDQLCNLVRVAVFPTPHFHVENHRINGETILMLVVQSSPSPPYGLVVDKGSRDKPEFFVRRGANTYPGQPSDLREAVLSRLPNGQGSGPAWAVS